MAIDDLIRRRFKSYGWRDRQRDKKRGAEDGRNRVPALDDDEYSFRTRVIAKMRRAYDAVVATVDRTEKRAKTRYEIHNARTLALVKSSDQLETRRAQMLRQVEDLIGPQSDRAGLARRMADQNRKLEIAFRDRLGREVAIGFEKLYLPIMAVFAIVEVPVNRLAFEFMFRESRLFSLILSLAVGALLMFMAHFIGMFLRRCGPSVSLIPARRKPPSDPPVTSAAREPGPAKAAPEPAPTERKTGVKWSMVFGALVLIAIAGTVIYYMALLRQAYVNELDAAVLGDLDALLLEQPAEERAAAALGTQLGAAGIFLLLLNTMILLVGIAFSFFHHDPNPEFEAAYRNKRRGEKAADALAKRHGREVNRVNRRFDKRAARLGDRTIKMRARADVWDAKLGACKRAKERALSDAASAVALHLLTYQEENLRVRKGQDKPRAFQWTEDDIRRAIQGAPDATTA